MSSYLLNAVSEKFLAALDRDVYSAEAFEDVLKAIEVGSSAQGQNPEITKQLEIVQNDVGVVTECFILMEQSLHKFKKNIIADMNALLDEELPLPQSRRADKPSLQQPRFPTTSPFQSNLKTRQITSTESTHSPSDPNPLPEFIEHAYKYLVTNIFDPYPSIAQKKAIVDKSSNTKVTLKSVSTWFSNARRRSGWNELKTRFNWDQFQMVDIAKQVFIRPRPLQPVDPEVVAEFMKIKEKIESMYEKTRASPWINDLEKIEKLVNPVPEAERVAAKKREIDEGKEARRLAKETLREQREFEKQKQKMQAEALRKAEIVTRQMQEKAEARRRRLTSTSRSSMPDSQEDDEEPIVIAGSKRKVPHDDLYSSFEVFEVSTPSRSSSFSSLSSDGRVPSLTWSDSGDERPHKRNKSIPLTPEPGIMGALSSFNSLYPSDDLLQVPLRGQKRSHSVTDIDLIPCAKRAKKNDFVAPPDVPPQDFSQILEFSLFDHGSDTTPTQSSWGRSNLVSPNNQDVFSDSVFDLSSNSSILPSIEVTPPEAELPIEVFHWENPVDDSLPADNLDFQSNLSQWLQLIERQNLFEGIDSVEFNPDMSSFSFALPNGSLLPLESSGPSTSQTLENITDAQNSFINSLLTPEAFDNTLSLTIPETGVLAPTTSSPSVITPLSHSDSLSPPDGALPPTLSTEKEALKAQKRRELQEKKAELERERARLAELERELEED